MCDPTTRTRLIFTLLLAFVCTIVEAQDSVLKAKLQNHTVKVDVDLVLVNATVSDALGRMVTGLGRENFQIWEDKVEQKIEYVSSEDTPLSIGLVFDATGSMSDKLAPARN